MAIKFDKYHRDYLLWIYPVFILVILIFMIRRDEKKGSTTASDINNQRADSSITLVMPENSANLRTDYIINDSALLLYALSK